MDHTFGPHHDNSKWMIEDSTFDIDNDNSICIKMYTIKVHLAYMNFYL